MVFVEPSSFVIDPSQPTDSTVLTFGFNAIKDFPNDALFITYTPVYYVMYRSSKPFSDKTGVWIELGRELGNQVMHMSPSEAIIISATKKLPAGKYDFMAVEQTDWKGTGRDDITHIGYITMEVKKDCSDRAMWCTPGCINESYVTCGDCPTKSGCGTACDTDACASGCEHANDPECLNKKCDITCQFYKAIEPINQYVPYIVGGAILLVLAIVVFKKRKTVSSGASSLLTALLKEEK